MKRFATNMHYPSGEIMAELQWTIHVGADGQLLPPREDVAVAAVAPGEYLVTLPLPIPGGSGILATVDSGFIAAAPGDDGGNKPNFIRVLTLRDGAFAPRDFTLTVQAQA
jgi:hypothetical protein